MDRRQSARINMRRVRARYARNLRATAIICLMIGLVAGFMLSSLINQPQAGSRNTDAFSGATSVAEDRSLTLESTQAPTENKGLVVSEEEFVQPTEVAPVAEEQVGAEVNVTPDPADAAIRNTIDVSSYAPVTAAADTAVPEDVASATPEGTMIDEVKTVVVPYGNEQTFSAQINNDGTTRRDTSTQTYDTLNFSMRVKRYLTPDYYESNYGSRYQMQGNEAGVEFELTLQDYMGDQEIVPQNLFTIEIQNEDGTIERGYKLTDAEIHGESNVTVETNIPKPIYKRYAYNDAVGDMDYLALQTVVDGVATRYLFELGDAVVVTAEPTAEPTPEVTLAPIGDGSRGENVRELQQMLIDQGFLDDDADGIFGANTAKAIKLAQAKYGMTETGVANHALIIALREATEG